MVDSDIILNAFEKFILKYGAKNCYVGITDNELRRFREHRVIDENNEYTSKECDDLYEDAETENNARDIEGILLKKYKNDDIKGGGKGGNGNSKLVYIYKIIPGVTNEKA